MRFTILKLPKHPSWLLRFACFMVLCAGCTSVESTMVTRDESNRTWERHNCLNGVPITLKVPTHLKLYVYHKHLLEPVKATFREPVLDEKGKQEKDGDEPVFQNVERVVGIAPVCMDVVVRDFAHEFMYTDKIFVVDFKRPAAGSSNLLVSMTEDQYIDQIQHDITEQTISQVGGLLGSFIGEGGLKSATETEGPPGEDHKPKYAEVRSLVAVGIFEVDAPDFEQKVRQFLNCHVNKSHDAWVAPPHVESVNRVGICPCDNTRKSYPLCPETGESSWEWVGDTSALQHDIVQ